VRYSFDLSRSVQLEPAVGYLTSTRVTLGNGEIVAAGRALFPEVSFTLHGTGQRWVPYAGGGVGASTQPSLIVPRATTLLGRAGIRYRFSEQFAATLGGQYRLFASYGHTFDLGLGLTLVSANPKRDGPGRARNPLIRGSQSPQRFAFATGAALPTKKEFGFFPTARLEWYVTDPNRPFGILADGYVSRTFAPADAGVLDALGHRGEVGFSVSVVPQLLPSAWLSPYVVGGIRWRRPWDPEPLTPEQQALIAASQRFGFPTPLPESHIEPNVAAGLRFRLPSGQALRLEMHYYTGLNYFPVTLGFSF
jgi:hypothetical protein